MYFPQETAQEFNDLIPFGTERVRPAFPVDSLPDKIHNYIEEVAESLQVAVDMAAVSALTVVSLCVQRKYVICPKADWKEPLNLYSTIAARPSERKSPVLEKMTRPIYEYMLEENERRKTAIDQYQIEKEVLTKKVESIKQAIGKENGKYSIQDVIDAQKELSELEEVKPVRLIADDVSPEALISLLYQYDGKMSVISSEGGIFEIAAGRYSDHVNIDVFLKAFSGDPIIVDRKGRTSETILNPALTMLLFVQPDVIREIMNNKAFNGRGFLARFLYCIPESRVGHRRYETKPITEESKRSYDGLIYRLLSIPDIFTPREIRLDQEAYEISKAYFGIIENNLTGELEEIEAWAGKYHGQVMRIAGILHCIKYEIEAYNNLLDRQTMLQAIQIGTYFLRHAQAAFEMMGATDDEATRNAKYILKRIESNGKPEINKSELIQLCNGKFRNVGELTEALKVLDDRGYIRTEKIKTGSKGRPRENILMNPEYWQPEE